jgi:3-(3-hydroxy-phenyl)propionate hydroxylase
MNVAWSTDHGLDIHANAIGAKHDLPHKESHPPVTLPVAIVGAGPVGLTTALGLAHYGVPFVLFEDEDRLSTETKAGTTLARSLEIWRRFGVAASVLQRSMRVDEIGDIDRRTNQARRPVELSVLANETRFPFVVNLPQQDMEPALAEPVRGRLQLAHRLVRFEQKSDRVVLHLKTPHGQTTAEASYLLGCDGGRSTVREQLRIPVEGKSLPVKYSLVDLEVDLDIANPRDYPYLAYFSDAQEWMILVRHPHCWRFLFPLPPGREEPSAEELRDKVLSFIGEAENVRVLGKVTYQVHHRVAAQWRRGRVFLMGDAAHLITPMWALGINTGLLDCSNLCWRLAWHLRGWADERVLDGYEREQKPVALLGAGEMAESARRYVGKESDAAGDIAADAWGNACTRAMLGVRLDVDGRGDWSMLKRTREPPLRPGDRIPDWPLHSAAGGELRVHDLTADGFAALYFADARRRPEIPDNTSPALRHYLVSRWDAPLDSGLRERALFDPGGAFERRVGCPAGTLVLVRPDEHIAAIEPIAPGAAERRYAAIVGRAPPSP